MDRLAHVILPALNASLNATSGLLLVCAWLAIRRRNVELHRRLVLAAFAASALFLVSYVTRMSMTGPTRFEGPGAVRAIYLVILGTHTLLAVAVLPLALRTAWLGWHRRDDAHRRIARWTLPVWLYVSVTGVIVYVMLYHLEFATKVG